MAQIPDTVFIKSVTSSFWSVAVLILVSLLLARWVATVFYNYFLNPLASVPGPAAARIFSSYMTRAIMKGRRAQTLLQLHERYGPLVRIGPNEVSISDHELYRQIYSHAASVKEEQFYRAAMLLGHDNIFSIRNKSKHAARRKIQSQPYSQQAINKNEPLIMEMVQRLVKRILSNSVSGDSAVDVYPLCGLFGLEVVCRAAFDRDIAARSTDDALDFLHCMDEGAVVLPISALFPSLRNYRLGERYLGEMVPGPIGYAFAQFRRWAQTTRTLFVEFKGRSKADTSECFLATPFITREDEFLGRKLTEDEAVEEAMGLAFAGSGTTSNTILYILYHLSRPENMAMQERLRNEVRAAGSNLADVKDLPYLNCVIKESMRLNPALMGTLPRTLITPIAADKSKGIVLPLGTTISMQNYVHQRNPTIYPNPDLFIPERWIGQDPSSSMEKALTPFSLGPRNCIGQNLAKAELYLAISTIFRHLDVRLSSGMKATDMEMIDRFAAAPVGRRLLLDVKELSMA